MNVDSKKRGVFLILIGAVLWGLSGTCGQYLLQNKGLTASWLIPIRLLTAGVIMLLLCFVKQGWQLFNIWKKPKDIIDIFIFGVFGMSMCQYTYFTTIGYSNAGSATVLQYIGPVLIVVYVSIKFLKWPKGNEIVAAICALIGTFLLATHGNIKTLVISKEALIWGILSAVALGIYTVQPARLLRQFGSMVTVAWGMVVGGILLSFIFQPWSVTVAVDRGIITAMAVVIVLGTMVSFCCYMEGVKHVGAKKGSLYACIEPVSATMFSVLWLDVNFIIMDFIGFIFILSTIFLLSLSKE